MSDPQRPKSMDEVLASIRKIIRSEKPDENTSAMEKWQDAAENVHQPPKAPPDDTPEQKPEQSAGQTPDEDKTNPDAAPLLLTPDMRVAKTDAEGPGPNAPTRARPFLRPQQQGQDQVPKQRAGDHGKKPKAESQPASDALQAGALPTDRAGLEALIQGIVVKMLDGELGENLSKTIQMRVQKELVRALSGKES